MSHIGRRILDCASCCVEPRSRSTQHRQLVLAIHDDMKKAKEAKPMGFLSLQTSNKTLTLTLILIGVVSTIPRGEKIAKYVEMMKREDLFMIELIHIRIVQKRSKGIESWSLFKPYKAMSGPYRIRASMLILDNVIPPTTNREPWP